MYELLVTPHEPLRIGLTGVEEIKQNIRLILFTEVGSVPLDRNFGFDVDPIDNPVNQVIRRDLPAAIEAIETYEPRVKVHAIGFVPDISAAASGTLYPRVEFEVAA